MARGSACVRIFSIRPFSSCCEDAHMELKNSMLSCANCITCYSVGARLATDNTT